MRIPPWKPHFVETADKTKKKLEKLDILVHIYNWENI